MSTLLANNHFERDVGQQRLYQNYWPKMIIDILLAKYIITNCWPKTTMKKLLANKDYKQTIGQIFKKILLAKYVINILLANYYKETVG